MARKPLTPSEQLVGRRLPPESTYRDQVMMSYVKDPDAAKEEDRFCGRFAPVDSWLRAPHRAARKKGWLRAGQVNISILGSKAMPIWYLTESGKIEALQARDRVLQTRARRSEWVQDFHAARKEYIAKKDSENDPDVSSSPKP